VHGEVTDHDVDIFDREAVFIDHVLSPILQALPGLKLVFEHLTSRQGVEFVLDAGTNVAATLTVHHLYLNRNAMFNKGLRPHHYCLPVLKREEHRQALVAAAISGNKKFFLGTDSAPHDRALKESSCGCAGMYSSPVALELYAQIFEDNDALDKLEGFASLNGPDFYGLPVNEERITLKKQDWQVPTIIKAGTEEIVPLCAGETLRWQRA
jgi:dihydroorotase